MKTIYILVASVLIFTSSCKEQSTDISTNDVMNSKSADGSNNSSLPDIKFEEETHDFGRITQGEKVTYAFKFKNTGGANLIISSANGSCGCTIPSYPKKPILPGEEALIDVVFASEGKSGVVEKSVTLVTNCEPSTKIIYIKANIIVPTSANPSELPSAH
jgi:flavin-dependent dehydrogenase